MARVKNTMKLIESADSAINIKYDMHASNIDDIYRKSGDVFNMITNGFKFGYMQGMKAAKAEMRAKA